MERRSMLVMYEGDERGTWRLYWTDTLELADPREFATLEEGCVMARTIVFPRPVPKLELVG